MSKRKLPTQKQLSSLSSKQLNLYKKSYKGGAIKDVHMAVFQDALGWVEGKTTGADNHAAARTGSRTLKVLYPGCHRHLTAALVFPDVTFVDCDPKVAPLYTDPVAREYVETHKVYDEDPRYEFYRYNVKHHNEKNMPKIRKGDYDLLISLSAGAMVEPCTPFVRSTTTPHDHGYLLVNDAHSDARTAFVSGKWKLLAYWDDDTRQFTADRLEQCFQVIVVVRDNQQSTKPISKEQVDESIAVGTVRKRSFRLVFEPMFFLFQKK